MKIRAVLSLLFSVLCFAPRAPALQVERQTVAVTCASDGSATVYSTVVTGRILAIIYVKTNFSNGVDFTITAEATGETIWTESNVDVAATKYPRAAVHDTAGVAATLDGTRAMRDCVHVAADRVKIVIAAGGNATTGSFIIITG